MPTPTKSIEVLKQENKSHRTKAEIAQREEAEKSLLTGISIKERPEVKANKLAHAEFIRLKKLLKIIGKDDALIETVINRYCLLIAECTDFENKREKFYENLDRILEDDSIENDRKYKLQAEMQKSIIDTDKQIQTKRKMLLDIERENGLTIAAALRSIPKKIEKESNPLLKALQEDD